MSLIVVTDIPLRSNAQSLGYHSLCQNHREKHRDCYNLLFYPYLSWKKDVV